MGLQSRLLVETLQFSMARPKESSVKTLNAFIALFLVANMAFLSACDHKSDSRKKLPKGSTRDRVSTSDASCKLNLGDDKEANCKLINEKKSARDQSAVCEIVWAKAFQSEQCDDQVATNDVVQPTSQTAARPAQQPAPKILAVKTDTAPDTNVTIETNRPNITFATARPQDLAVVERANFTTRSITHVMPVQTMATQPAELFIPIAATQVTPASLVSNPKACEMIGKVNVRARAFRADLDIALDTYKTSLSNWARMVCTQDPTEAQALWREVKFQLGGSYEGHTGAENCWRELTGLATACSQAIRGGDSATVFNSTI